MVYEYDERPGVGRSSVALVARRGTWLLGRLGR